jgi:hypothetical protein
MVHEGFTRPSERYLQSQGYATLVNGSVHRVSNERSDPYSYEGESGYESRLNLDDLLDWLERMSEKISEAGEVASEVFRDYGFKALLALSTLSTILSLNGSGDVNLYVNGNEGQMPPDAGEPASATGETTIGMFDYAVDASGYLPNGGQGFYFTLMGQRLFIPYGGTDGMPAEVIRGLDEGKDGVTDLEYRMGTDSSTLKAGE